MKSKSDISQQFLLLTELPEKPQVLVLTDFAHQIDQMLNLNCPEKSSCNPTLSTSSKRRVKKEPRNRTGRVAQAWPSAAVVRAGCLSLSCPNESPQISVPVLNTAADLLWCGQRRACTGKLLRSAAQQGPAAPNLLLSSISRKGGQVWGSRRS